MNPPSAGIELPPVAFSHRREWASHQSISYLMQQGLENRDCISLAAGFVDEATLPTEFVRNAVSRLVTDDADGQRRLQYGNTSGNRALRSLLLDHLAGVESVLPEQLAVTENNIVVTSGSQQILNHIADVVLDPGDICLVAGPTYFVFMGTLAGVGANVIAVEADEDGMRMDCLEAELQRIQAAGELHRVKMIYLVSWFENPSGVTLSMDRRRQVVDIARRWSKQHRILILEDAAYRELRFEGEELPSIWMCDETRQQVILAQTFSKSFSPGIRVGYAVLPDDVVPAINDVKGNFDFGSPNFAQEILAEALRSGAYRSHVDKLRSAYRVKRDAMLSAADEFFSDIPGVSWLRPRGGLYVWMTLPDGMDTGFQGALFHAATREQGVMYVPGAISYPTDSRVRRDTQMRLSYGVESPETIREGMRRLAVAVKNGLRNMG